MTKDHPQASSEEFYDSLEDNGRSSMKDCGFCERTHFGYFNDALDWEEGKYEKLVAKAKSNPDKYIQHNDNDTVFFGVLDSRVFVYDCPCNSITPYE
jgi:hypothetical protein